MRSPLLARVALGALLVTIPAAAAAAAEPCRTVVDVDVRWEKSRAETVSGIVVRIGYPPSLDVPVEAESGSSRERVDNLTGKPGGLFDAVRKDTDGDGAGDLLSVGLVTQGMKPGPFVRVAFDCGAATAVPPLDAFTCTADVADEQGHVPASCAVRAASGATAGAPPVTRSSHSALGAGAVRLLSSAG